MNIWLKGQFFISLYHLQQPVYQILIMRVQEGHMCCTVVNSQPARSNTLGNVTTYTYGCILENARSFEGARYVRTSMFNP